MKLPRYMDPRPCRPSRDPEAVRQIIERESADKGDPADHPMSHWWHCVVCRTWHPVTESPAVAVERETNRGDA